MRAPIHSNKHYVQWTLSTVATLTRGFENIVDAVAPQDVNAVTEVVEGAVVKAVYLELWVQGTSGSQTAIIVIAKAPAGTGLTYADSTGLGTYDNKKNVLHVMQGIPGNDGVANPTLAFKGWIKIPKGKQRFGLGDRLQLTISNPSADTLNYCGFATYKEYT